MERLIQDWKRRASVFAKDKIAIHIVTKQNSWLNGYVLDIYDDYFYILDREDGRVPVFFADIRILELFTGDESTLKKLEGENESNKL